MGEMTARWTFHTTPEGKRSVRVEWSDARQPTMAGGRPVITPLARRTAEPRIQAPTPLRGAA